MLFFDTWEDVSLPNTAADSDFQLILLGGASASSISSYFGVKSASVSSMEVGTELPIPGLGDDWSAGTSDSTVPTDEDIIVIGKISHEYSLPEGWGSNYSNDSTGEWTVVGSGEGAGGSESSLPDEASIQIQFNITRPLTASEQEAVKDLKITIEKITAAIASLADDAILRLPNGADVTGAELKNLWAKVDFVINDGATYQNGGGGEARMWYGEPTISFNIQYLDQYDNSTGGMNYLVAHELGHLSQAGDPYYYSDQRTANDIARALLSGAGLEYLADPGYGYTTTAPTQFSAPSSGGDAGGGSTGGGGQTYDDIIP